MIVALSADDVYQRWDWLREGILAVAAKTGGRFRPEDVYVRLRTSTAWAYALRDANEDDIGFLIVTQEYDPDGLVLFVWILWAPSHEIRGRENEMYQEFERIAVACKAKRIRMQSPRRGWEREGFFDRVAVVYEHEVTNG